MVNTIDDIPEDHGNNYITKAEDYRLRTKAINDNAQLVTNFFVARMEDLIERVLKPYFGVREHIIRYEFQKRKSIHAHCMFVVDNGPSEPTRKMAFGKE